MTQKDKVKELVGRGLDSYHTKSLQQIDRIEKKNKEQNHKISILTNELDNDYLTKTEEGSVISLEHSKEGMVYLDELQGNTLVNYCTDGSKEMTLNGDIDVEGIFVTTTEGVDGGKIDVMCEGNTLVNLIKQVDGSTYTHYPLTIGEIYTLIVEFTSNSECNLYIEENITWANLSTTSISGVKNGYNKFVVKLTIPSNYIGTEKINITNRVNGTYDGNVKFTDVKPILLKGDWTNKEMPTEYFGGIKSVGECEDNKIEILSQNKNLCTVNSYSGVCHNKIETNIPCKKNTIYTLTFKDESDLNQSGSRGITLITHKTKTDSTDHGVIYTHAMGEGGEEYTFRESGFTFNTSDCCYISLTSNNMSSVPNLIIKEIQIEEGSQTSYSPHTFNKKEILINEPLRSIENINKDRIVKIGNKWFIERNLAQITLDGTEKWVKWTYETSLTQLDTHLHCTIRISNIKYYSKECANVITDKFKSTNNRGALGEYIYHDGWNDTICIKILQSKLETPDASGFKKWLQNNPIELIYELATPIYEPLAIEPTLNTYNDITHISNNSIIPCNMKIKNSGYNAIIKPSTQYTVALDTNKSGTIGVNLGGAKVTTTNNVATITTPATLTDDSLRLYGKGIKGSKVRLLEGYKTNWIPSFFEGMQSSFEDKVQEDGSYKMEILSNNKNLFNKNILEKVNSNYYEIINKDNRRCLKIERPSLMYRTRILNQLKKNTSYKISFDMLYDRIKGNGMAQGASIHIVYTDGSSNSCYASTSYNEWLNASIITPSNKTIHYIQFSYGTNTPTYIDLDTFIIQENNNLVDYVYHKSNKIQFSSIEPLRSVGNIKDRFVFKDGKLIIQRNIGKHFITKDSVLSYGRTNSSVTRVNFNAPNFDTNDVSKIKVLANKYPSGENDKLHGSYVNNVIGITGDKYMRIMLTNLELGISSSTTPTTEHINAWLDRIGGFTVSYQLAEPTYEEMPFELQKIILEGYENGTLFFDTNIPPTSTVTYAGETPIVKATKLNKTEVSSNTDDINDNIIPYLMDMDYRVVCLQLQTENINNGVSMARLFGGTYEMLQRDIQSKRYSIDEYKHRLDAYLGANKITEEEYNKLGDMLNE